MADVAADGGGVSITLKDVWQAQTATTDKIGEINVSLTRILGHMDAQLSKNSLTDRELADHEGRLRALERWRYALPTAVLLGFGSAVVAIVDLIATHAH